MLASDTWALAPADMRPWLLMIWHTAWIQRPAGSFPNDHQIIAARIGMDARIFSAHADILLRGFRLHADGRLYHPVVVEQVLTFLEYRDNERIRKAKYRNRMKREESCPTGQTRDGRGSPMGRTAPEPEPESSSLRSEDITHRSSDESPKNGFSGRAKHAKTPFSEIWNLWREMLPELPAPHSPEHWTPARKAQIRARWNDQLPDLDSWRQCFELIRKSQFLMGKVNGTPGRRPFRADLFWVTKPENLLKIYEGKYHA